MVKDSFYTFSEYMKENALTANEEDYLEMIYRLCQSTKYTRVNDLSNALHVKPPSVSNMLKKLSNKKLIKHVEYGTIELTIQGEEFGKALLDRHNCVEHFLKILDIKGNLIEEAEKIEHTLSQDTLQAIRKLVVFFEENDEVLKQFNDFIL
ncbi:metal-dependent transcriptional regulator [Mycoplasmatota bacterium]|nr:metal-dependent transcriptional regulator [Mycoplasmatota bacterium]